ncbi:MAG: SpoIIE family protein phosphatase [Planctomycetes bacterium]|nr:SpoIIE family protein phosphatase [Planctomycetota bacterium]
MGLAARFAIGVSLALILVMGGAGSFLFQRTQAVVESRVDTALSQAAAESRTALECEESGEAHHKEISTKGILKGNGVMRMDVKILAGPNKGKIARRYSTPDGRSIVVPAMPKKGKKKDLLSLFTFVTGMVILVGAGVASLIAKRVARPLEDLVQDVRIIARGNLNHRTHVRGSGEVRQLATAIDRMGGSLAEAQASEVELGVRLREREVALEVAKALLPSEEPWVDGYRITGDYVASDEPGGSFFDFCGDGARPIFMVCDVSGQGVPGSLVGATARAYLRSTLQSKTDLGEALAWVNQQLHRDVERGLFVTAMVVVLDPIEHVAHVACAGHKMPLLRYDAEEGQLKSMQPNGFALGFDAGPMFERRLEVVQMPFQPGDRLVLSGAGVAGLPSKSTGEEWGEKGLYRSLLKHAKSDAQGLLSGILQDASKHSGQEVPPSDYSLVVISRDPA